MARYWVSGATGFLGSHVVSALARAGHEIVAVARSASATAGVPVRSVDVLDAAAVAESAKGCDGAFLAAGKVSRDAADAEELHRINVVGTRTQLAGLRQAGVKRAVVASTSGTLAISKDSRGMADETSEPPRELIAKWPYYRSKLYGELEALEANDPPGFEVVVVNPSLLLGPGDLRGSSTSDVRRFLDGEVLATPRGGLALVDVRDAAAGMVAAMVRGRAGERYLLSAANLTVAAFFDRLARVSDVPSPVMPLPRSSALAAEATRLFARAVQAIGGQLPMDATSVEMAQHYWYCDSGKAIRELGWSPRDVTVTLRDTVSDLIERGVAHPRVGRFSVDGGEGVGAAGLLHAGGDAAAGRSRAPVGP